MPSRNYILIIIKCKFRFPPYPCKRIRRKKCWEHFQKPALFFENWLKSCIIYECFNNVVQLRNKKTFSFFSYYLIQVYILWNPERFCVLLCAPFVFIFFTSFLFTLLLHFIKFATYLFLYSKARVHKGFCVFFFF